VQAKPYYPTKEKQGNQSEDLTVQGKEESVSNTPEVKSCGSFADIPTLGPEIQERSSNEELSWVQRVFKAERTPNYPVNPYQAKLTIGQPGDKYEQEADRVANRIVRQINTPPTPSNHEQSIQRLEIKERRDKLGIQGRLAVGGREASQDLSNAINSARGRGQSLDAGLQQSMGQAMGANFSRVRIHTDANSDHLNESIQAKAFTTGNDVFFRRGAYEPGSRRGQELIAHELTHVLQQNSGLVDTYSIQRDPRDDKPETSKEPSLEFEDLMKAKEIYEEGIFSALGAVDLGKLFLGKAGASADVKCYYSLGAATTKVIIALAVTHTAIVFPLLGIPMALLMWKWESRKEEQEKQKALEDALDARKQSILAEVKRRLLEKEIQERLVEEMRIDEEWKRGRGKVRVRYNVVGVTEEEFGQISLVLDERKMRSIYASELRKEEMMIELLSEEEYWRDGRLRYAFNKLHTIYSDSVGDPEELQKRAVKAEEYMEKVLKNAIDSVELKQSEGQEEEGELRRNETKWA